MTTQPALLPTAEHLARLFHRTYERMGPAYGYGQGVSFDHLTDTYRMMLVDVFADMELALRPGRQVTELHDGQAVVLLVTDPTSNPDHLTRLRDAVAAWLPGHQVHIAAGVSHAITVDGGDG